MKEIKYIFNTVAILGFIASLIAFFASVYFDYCHDRVNSFVTLEIMGIMFFVSFLFGIIGITTDD